MPEDSRKYRVSKSSIHGLGVFAARDIKCGEEIIEYLGEKISKEESNKRGLRRQARAKKTGEAAVYIFELDDDFDLDGDIPGNDAKYINHACRTNSEAVSDGEHIHIVATRDIREGEEILYNYGYAFEHFPEHPCKCGFPECVGYIVSVEDRPKLRRFLSRHAKNKRLKGKNPPQGKA